MDVIPHRVIARIHGKNGASTNSAGSDSLNACNTFVFELAD
jgi:hypothetical protein